MPNTPINNESIIGDLVTIGSAEIYIRDVRVTNIQELETELKKLKEEEDGESRNGL